MANNNNNDLTLKNIIDYVFIKGTKERSWVEENERGIKAIDFRYPFKVRGLDDFNVHTIALYVYDGELVCSLHGYSDADEYCEEYITHRCDELSDAALDDLYDVVSTIDMEEESWNVSHSD